MTLSEVLARVEAIQAEVSNTLLDELGEDLFDAIQAKGYELSFLLAESYVSGAAEAEAPDDPQ